MKKRKTKKPRQLTGAQMIAAERKRQVSKEGWTPEHDDKHEHSELACAAIAYAASACVREVVKDGRVYRQVSSRRSETFTDVFPGGWSPEWDKRATHPRLKKLVIAGALIAAEIDRLNRINGGLPW